jgi:hypothetical protein
VSVISALERLRQENCKLGASQSYIARPYLKKKKKKNKKNKNKIKTQPSQSPIALLWELPPVELAGLCL